MPPQPYLAVQAAQLLVAISGMQTYEHSAELLWDFIDWAVASAVWLAFSAHDPSTARVGCCAALTPGLIGSSPFACISAYVALVNAAHSQNCCSSVLPTVVCCASFIALHARGGIFFNIVAHITSYCNHGKW